MSVKYSVKFNGLCIDNNILKITILCASINVKMSKTIMTMNNQALETVQGIER